MFPNQRIDPALWDCLESLVGISREFYACTPVISAVMQSRLRRSTTDFYVSEEANLSVCMALRNLQPGQKSIYDLLLEARHSAVLEIIKFVTTAFSGRLQINRNVPLMLGEEKTNGPINANLTTAKVRFRTNDYFGASLHITAISIAALLSPTNTEGYKIATVNIGKSDGTTLVSYALAVTDKTSSWTGKQPNPELQTLPDGGVYLPCDGSEYMVWYELDGLGSIVPQNNEIRCIKCGGNSQSLLPFFAVIPSGDANGIRLQMTLTCNPAYLSCSLTHNFTAALIIADMLRAKTIELFIARTIANGGATTYKSVLNLANANDLLEGYANQFRNGLEQLLTIETHQLSTDCFTCTSGRFATRSGLLQ